MKMLNVIGIGMSSVLCASLLTACADGRGTNGFKSYEYSKEERAQNKARAEALNKTPGSGDVGTGSTTPALPPDSGRGLDTPLFTPAPVAGTKGNESAQPRVINEQGKANPSGVLEMTAKVQDLNVTIEGELKEENPTAKGLVKGVTVMPNAFTQATAVTIQAVVVINKEEVYFDAANVPVKFLKSEEQMPNILFTLSKPCDSKTILAKDLLQAGVKCGDANCQSIQLILSFKTEGRPANAILVLQAGKKDGTAKAQWLYKASNIGTPMTFLQAQKSCEMAKIVPPEEGKTIPAAESAKTVPALENAKIIPAPEAVQALPAPTEVTKAIEAPEATKAVEAPAATTAVVPAEEAKVIGAPAPTTASTQATATATPAAKSTATSTSIRPRSIRYGNRK